MRHVYLVLNRRKATTGTTGRTAKKTMILLMDGMDKTTRKVTPSKNEQSCEPCPSYTQNRLL